MENDGAGEVVAHDEGIHGHVEVAEVAGLMREWETRMSDWEEVGRGV